MANHGYITTKQILTMDKLFSMVEKINNDVLNGALKISRPNANIKKDDVVFVEITKDLSRLLWLQTKKKIEIRHGGGGDVAWWIDSILTNDLAIAVDGKISDDGCDGKWDPIPGKYRTFLDYKKSMWEHNQNPTKDNFIYMDWAEEVEYLKQSNPKLLPFVGKLERPNNQDEFMIALNLQHKTLVVEKVK